MAAVWSPEKPDAMNRKKPNKNAMKIK